VIIPALQQSQGSFVETFNLSRVCGRHLMMFLMLFLSVKINFYNLKIHHTIPSQEIFASLHTIATIIESAFIGTQIFVVVRHLRLYFFKLV
jgi:hypothetical protein